MKIEKEYIMGAVDAQIKQLIVTLQRIQFVKRGAFLHIFSLPKYL